MVSRRCAISSLGARGLRARPRQLGVAREQQLLQRLDIIGKRIISAHRQ